MEATAIVVPRLAVIRVPQILIVLVVVVIVHLAVAAHIHNRHALMTPVLAAHQVTIVATLETAIPVATVEEAQADSAVVAEEVVAPAVEVTLAVEDDKS